MFVKFSSSRLKYGGNVADLQFTLQFNFVDEARFDFAFCYGILLIDKP